MVPEQELFFEQLYRNLFPELKIYAMRSLQNDAQAEEVVQDTFHEALQKIDILMCHKNPEAWLVLTLQNKIRNHRRSIRKNRERVLSLDVSVIEELGWADATIEAVLDKLTVQDTEQRVRQALTDEEQYILRRLVFEEATHREVAQELGISVWTSQKRLERIRDKLEKLFPGSCFARKRSLIRWIRSGRGKNFKNSTTPRRDRDAPFTPMLPPPCGGSVPLRGSLRLQPLAWYSLHYHRIGSQRSLRSLTVWKRRLPRRIPVGI